MSPDTTNLFLTKFREVTEAALPPTTTLDRHPMADIRILLAVRNVRYDKVFSGPISDSFPRLYFIGWKRWQQQQPSRNGHFHHPIENSHLVNDVPRNGYGTSSHCWKRGFYADT
ncbi:hypothetical protein AVEN_4492-1 [Araneus ventricosus]|uniref:Uncharacterized protein n=1 Tax=Araneus ventricosus TaxID=182803 RepID=A0A4Y2BL35_ARAVE|nr:hypothetical protein AVEN_4492-1 [Araneus ventricosus]